MICIFDYNQNHPQMKILEKNSNESVNSIGKGSVLDGSINAPGDIRIDGVVKGALIAGGRLVLGKSGQIEGDVQCGSAVISGELKANITSKELLVLKETAQLYGDIKTEKISIEPGAMFSGRCEMGPSPSGLKQPTANIFVSNDKTKTTTTDQKKESNKKENEKKI